MSLLLALAGSGLSILIPAQQKDGSRTERVRRLRQKRLENLALTKKVAFVLEAVIEDAPQNPIAAIKRALKQEGVAYIPEYGRIAKQEISDDITREIELLIHRAIEEEEILILLLAN